MSLQDVLNDKAEVEDPTFSWDVLSNAFGAVKIEAATRNTHEDRAMAYEDAERLLAALEPQAGGRAISDGMIGAKWDGPAGRWRGYLNVNFYSPGL